MPLFKGKASKSTPNKAIAYITNPQKAALVSVRNLFEDENYAKQFTRTMRRFGKGIKRDERKYYHFKLSCDRKDKVTPERAQIYAEELTARLFPDCECVIATHTDTKTVHSHIIVNAVNPLTGKKLRLGEQKYTAMKDEANRLGKEFGFTPIDFRKNARNKRTAEETHVILKGGTSWKEDLREVIEEAKRIAATEEEFIARLALYNVTLTRSKTEYSYLHPQKQKPIRGKRLGENYSKEVIERVIAENGHGRNVAAASGASRAERAHSTGGRKRPAKRGVGDIQREIERLNQTAEQAHSGTSGGHSGDGIQSDERDEQICQGNAGGSVQNGANAVRAERRSPKSDFGNSM